MERRRVPRLFAVMKITEPSNGSEGLCLPAPGPPDGPCSPGLLSPLSCFHGGVSGGGGCPPSISGGVEGTLTVESQAAASFFLLRCSCLKDSKRDTNFKSIAGDFLNECLSQPETLPLPSIWPVLSSGPRYCDFTRSRDSPTHPRAPSSTNVEAALCQPRSHDIFR